MAAYEITAGPSKFDLMIALFDQKRLRFTLSGEEKVVSIQTIQREDGSNESWNIGGRFVRDDVYFRAYYNTQRRTGQLTTD